MTDSNPPPQSSKRDDSCTSAPRAGLAGPNWLTGRHGAAGGACGGRRSTAGVGQRLMPAREGAGAISPAHARAARWLCIVGNHGADRKQASTIRAGRRPACQSPESASAGPVAAPLPRYARRPHRPSHRRPVSYNTSRRVDGTQQDHRALFRLEPVRAGDGEVGDARQYCHGDPRPCFLPPWPAT